MVQYGVMIPKSTRLLLSSALALAACVGFFSGTLGVVFCHGADGQVAISICPVEPCGPDSLRIADEEVEAAQKGASGSDCRGPCVDVPVAGYLRPPLLTKVITTVPVDMSSFLETGSTPGRLGGRSNDNPLAAPAVMSDALVSLRTVVLLI